MADSSLSAKTSSNKKKSRNAPYEPEATNLVIQIQNGINVETNKNRLAELILPFITRVVGNNLDSFYTRQDTDDAVQEFILTNILDDDPTRRKFMCLYKYDHLYKKEDGFQTSFCRYIKSDLDWLCTNWNERYNEAKHRGPSFDVDNDDSPEAKASAASKAEVSTRISQRDAELRDHKEMIPLLAINFKRFFNAINSLDKDKTYGKPFQDGERVINEQKLLAYHIRFINKVFRLSPKSREYSIERFRAFSYMQVNYKNNDYLQKEEFRTTIDFMKILEERIVSRNLTNNVFLPPEKKIKTTVNDWLQAPTMKKRTDAECAKLQADNIRTGEEYGYGIRV